MKSWIATNTCWISSLLTTGSSYIHEKLDCDANFQEPPLGLLFVAVISMKSWIATILFLFQQYYPHIVAVITMKSWIATLRICRRQIATKVAVISMKSWIATNKVCRHCQHQTM